MGGVLSLHITPRRPLVATLIGSSIIAVQLAFTTLQARIPEEQLGRDLAPSTGAAILAVPSVRELRGRTA